MRNTPTMKNQHHSPGDMNRMVLTESSRDLQKTTEKMREVNAWTGRSITWLRITVESCSSRLNRIQHADLYQPQPPLLLLLITDIPVDIPPLSDVAEGLAGPSIKQTSDDQDSSGREYTLSIRSVLFFFYTLRVFCFDVIPMAYPNLYNPNPNPNPFSYPFLYFYPNVHKLQI